VAVVTLLVFGRSIAHEFTNWDDPQTISANKNFLPPTMAKIAGYWRLFPNADAGSTQTVNNAAGLWVPLTYTVWGALATVAQVRDPASGTIELNPYFYHAASVAVHTASALVVFHLLRRFLRRWNDSASTTPAAIGALLFALHPFAAETVGWASGLKDLLAGFFGLAALFLLVVHTDATPQSRPRVLWWAATASVVLAMLCKPSAMTIPLLAFVIMTLVFRVRGRAPYFTLIAWLAIVLPFAIVARFAQPPIEIAPPPMHLRPLVAADAVAFYLQKLIAPVGLTVDYGRTPASIIASGAVRWTWLVPAFALLAALLVYRRLRRREPDSSTIPLASLAIFALAPLPVLGLVPFLFQFYSTTADHYVYVAMLGPAILLAWLTSRLPRILPLATAVVIACGVTSFLLIGSWRDTESLFTRVVAINPDSFAAHNALGTLASIRDDWEEAELRFLRAVQLRPQSFPSVKNLRELYTRTGRPNEALEMLRREVKLKQSLPYAAAGPFWTDPNHLGALLLLKGKTSEAVNHFTVLVRLQPDNIDAMKLLVLAQMLAARPGA
jgi:protein O-mannosyl-transferase